ncbi:MAG: ACT domain-containing protein [Candidatus Micrarchaeia archaeon]
MIKSEERKKITHFTIIEEDRIGLLADISEALAREGINIESMSASTISGRAVIHITTATEKNVREILRKNGFNVLPSNSIVVKLVNKPGELSKVARLLADNGINIENVYLVFESNDTGYYALKVDKKEEAEDLLADFIES